MTGMRIGSHHLELCLVALPAGDSLQTSEAIDMYVLLSYACPDLCWYSCVYTNLHQLSWESSQASRTKCIIQVSVHVLMLCCHSYT